MKVIKRDGRAVDFDRQKIEIAIGKANKEVIDNEKATNQEIKDIVNYIESLGKKRMLVEDIQDIIEQKLMEFKRYDLAKKYIVYRYTRALVRKQNTTDESILGMIRNDSKEKYEEKLYFASAQRDYIAGEVSRDLTNRLLLPEKITKADQDGILHFHNTEYFIQPIINCSLINIADMLDNGTVINNIMIETPKSFKVACIVTSQIIATIASSQYGGQSIDLMHLGKYVRKSYVKIKNKLEQTLKNQLPNSDIENITNEMLKEEISNGIQTIFYQLNTLITNNRCEPFITLFLHLEPDDEYIKENAMLIEEMLKQRLKGIKNGDGINITPKFPKIVYVLDENNNLNGNEYDYLTKLAMQCTINGKNLSYISAKKMRENYEGNLFSPCGAQNFLQPWKDENGNYKFEGRFNQGTVTINLPQIAIVSDGDEEIFWKELEERLELCKDALMCRHYSLLGTYTDISPIHWQHGAISRLGKGEKIDKLLKDGYSSLSLGYVGIYETTKLMTGMSNTTKQGHDFAIKLLKKINKTINKWKNETGLGFVLYGNSKEGLCKKFALIDKERFGTIQDITDKGFYTNSYHVNQLENIDIFEKLKFESEFQDISSGGSIETINIKDINNSELEKIIKYLYDNIQYAEINVK